MTVSLSPGSRRLTVGLFFCILNIGHPMSNVMRRCLPDQSMEMGV